MVVKRTKRVTQEYLLSVFPLFLKCDFHPSLNNLRVLLEHRPKGVKSRVLRFTIPRAMSWVTEKFILDLSETWKILDAELKVRNLRGLDSTAQDYLDMKRIRNKIVAHKLENLITSPDHEDWYIEIYGNPERVLQLLERVAETINNRIIEANIKTESSGSVHPTRIVNAFDKKELIQTYDLFKTNA